MDKYITAWNQVNAAYLKRIQQEVGNSSGLWRGRSPGQAESNVPSPGGHQRTWAQHGGARWHVLVQHGILLGNL